MRYVICSIFFFAGCIDVVQATHVRGGYIRVMASNGSLNYKIEFIGFTDTGSTVKFGGGDLDFGDGTIINLEKEAIAVESIMVDNATKGIRFVVQHTYQAPGNYTIGFREFYRNAGILNMEASVETPFFASANIVVDPLLGSNSMPQLAGFPGIYKKAGTRSFTSLAFVDEEGDSLVYSLAVPQSNLSENVLDYRWPNDDRFYSGENRAEKPAFRLDRLSGQLIWDAPTMEGEFSAAYRVIEYRKVDGTVYKLSETTVDLQLLNKESELSAPSIEFDYVIAEPGRIDFTATYADDSDLIPWTLIYNHGTVTLGNTSFSERHLSDTIQNRGTLTGFFNLGPDLESPLIVILTAKSLTPGNPFTVTRSFAIDPSGKEFVINSVSKPDQPGQVDVYPNPVSEWLTMKLIGIDRANDADIELINAAGQSILKTTLSVNSNLATLNVNGIPGGIYMLHTHLNGGIYYSRLIKE